MTTKVNEVVIDALEDLVVQADEAPIEPSEAAAAIRVLNDMMFMWAARGIDLGFTEVNDMGDVMTVPAGAIFGIKAALAISLAGKYEVPIPESVLQKAKAGWEAILNLSVEIAAVEYPSTLPKGSGNDYPSYSSSHFYSEPDSTILTETGGSVALEDDTEEA